MGKTEELVGLYYKLRDYLRELTGSTHGTGFDELVDKAAEKNGIVKSEARRIKDFGKLGDTIWNHNFYQIAEPTKKAFSEFKRLVENITSPKNLIPTFRAEIKCFSPKSQLVTALRYMRDNDFSQVVIKDRGKLSLLTAEGVAKWLEQQTDKNIITLDEVKIGDALACDLPNTFVVMGPEDTIYDAQQAFKTSIEKSRPRLFAVLITDNGKRTGKPIGIVTPWDLTPAEEPSEDFVFRKNGDFWNIVFDGKSILLKNSTGLHYIAYLLQKPGEDIRVSTLYSAARATHVDSAASIYESMSKEQLEQYGLSVSHGLGDAGAMLDPRSVSEYKEFHQNLVEELEKAKGRGDSEQVAFLKEQIGIISAQLKSARGLKGKVRKSKDEKEKARKAVANRIMESLKKIQQEHESLGLHLSNTIRTGTSCSYNPEKPIPWNF